MAGPQSVEPRRCPAAVYRSTMPHLWATHTPPPGGATSVTISPTIPDT